jgi:hypothetical protein
VYLHSCTRTHTRTHTRSNACNMLLQIVMCPAVRRRWVGCGLLFCYDSYRQVGPDQVLGETPEKKCVTDVII